MRSTRTESRARPPRALTYNGIHSSTFAHVVDLLQVNRSGVYLGVQAGATVVGVQGESSRASSAVWGGDGTLIGVVGVMGGGDGSKLGTLTYTVTPLLTPLISTNTLSR